ncbi:nucleoside/nucleotide kinase family protein [Hymenobacter weizhouensis]|uniref:hypothetical protein n=1 Tax=Hymenobacter sp. YIM 151500-1 TaxID=2987689 RepID=UPI0022264E9B|nr:hypothetical protein [Hymenobacter sp. YIM 151500-1]UYZ62319.1 hypothetical protein OIS53_15130 [Hymenobacter sp. YIM 151500-1]
MSDTLSDRLQLTYRPDLDILVGRWTRQPEVSMLPAIYDHLTQTALNCGAHFWLQDIRRRTFNDPTTTDWLLTTYFPEVSRRLGGRLHVAYLVGPGLMHHLLSGPWFLPPEAYHDKPFNVAFFGDEGEAVAWLHRQRQ